jgi:hypothetical protein
MVAPVIAVGSGGFYVLIALGVVAIGVSLAWLVLRFTNLEPPFDFGAVDALVGIVYGILLAILVLFASTHYTAAINDSNREATSLNDMYKAAGPLDPKLRNTIRHEIVCYARETIADEWPVLRKSNGTGSPVVFARTRQLSGVIEEVAAANPENLTVSTLFTSNLARGESRQLMLEDSRPQIPAPLWLVVLIGMGVVVFLLSIRYWEKKAHLVVGLVTSLALLVAMVGAIAELDRPFAPVIGLKPSAMESVLTSVVQSSTQSAAALAPCKPVG